MEHRLLLSRTRDLLFIAYGCSRHVLCLFQTTFTELVTGAQREQEMRGEEYSSFIIDEVHLVRASREHSLHF